MSAQSGAWRPVVSSGFIGRPPGYGWMFANTSWIALFFLPNALGAWVAFLIIGLAVRRVQWIVAAGIYLGLAIAVLFIPGPTPQAFFAAGLQAATYVHGIIAARSWLRTLWGRRERGERLLGPDARRAVGGARGSGLDSAAGWDASGNGNGNTNDNASARSGQRRGRRHSADDAAAALLGMPGTNKTDYLAGPGASGADSGAAAGAVAGGAVSGREASGVSSMIDVNHADAEALASLPGMNSSRAAKAITLRNTELFSSPQQFADAMRMQPHEFARIEKLIVATGTANPSVQVRARRPIRRLDF